ncbi:MAG: BON domain-containing protein [Cyclobacteriaceae bacterium]|nr:BON domain-containing protein [Cyclobacteriaceae bacterium]
MKNLSTTNQHSRSKVNKDNSVHYTSWEDHYPTYQKEGQHESKSSGKEAAQHSWGEHSTAPKTSHKGKGPKGYKRTDARIEEDINEELTQDSHIDSSDITVKVVNGEVLLTGTVMDKVSKRRAEDLAESIAGVTNVENLIRYKK